MKRVCDYCQSEIRVNRYTTHLRRKCPASINKNTQYERTQLVGIIWFQCDYCKSKIKRQDVRKHLQEVHWNDECVCRECGGKFKVPEFVIHIKRGCPALKIEICGNCNIRLKKTLMDDHRLHCKKVGKRKITEPHIVPIINTVPKAKPGRYICRQCGKPAIPGNNVCYFCI